MHTAPCVHIKRRFRIKAGSVGVPCNQTYFMSLCIIVQTLLYFVLSDIVLSGTGRVKDAGMFQGLPEISDKKACQPPAGGI